MACGVWVWRMVLNLYPSHTPYVIRHTPTPMTSFLGKTWQLRVRDPQRSVVDKLFEVRGGEERFSVSDPREELHDPYLMADMEKACERLERARDAGEKVVVFGDYDVDGVTATAVLVRTLHKLGVQVSYRIPHRVKDGYSLKNYFLDELHALGVTVVITVDNGIAAAREIAHANELGMEIIVTDHHTPPPADELPVAHSILNPKMEGCMYPCKELSGSAVAMKLCIALSERNMKAGPEREAFIDKLYQVAGIGIVADCMNLIEENRSIVRLALDSINNRPLRGVSALLKKAGIDPQNVRASDIAFGMAPRLNAAGRLDSAYDALHLFLNQSAGVDAIADRLDIFNRERRAMTQATYDEALEEVSAGPSRSITIVLGENWPPGVIGLVASRLVEARGVPAIVLASKGDILVASCRSIPSFDMVSHLRVFGEMFEHFGGHAMAAGFSILPERFALFKEAMQLHAAQVLGDMDLSRVLEIDTDIQREELTLSTLQTLSLLEPFGQGNPHPLFLLENVTPNYVKVVGSDQSHLSFKADNTKAIAFRMGSFAEQMVGKQVDLVVQLDRNEWQGVVSPQLMVRDIREHQPEHHPSLQTELRMASSDLIETSAL